METQIFDRQFPEDVPTNPEENESEVKYFRKKPYQKLNEEINYSNEDSDDLSQGSSVESNSRSEMDYDNWDDPNELVDRLRLIFSRQAAGDFSHNNEWVSIIEESRKAGYIE